MHVLNSHILPRQNLSAPVSRKPEHPIFFLLISASYPAIVMNLLYIWMCVFVCVHMCACQSEVACRLSFVGSSIAIFWWLCVIQCQKETLRVPLNLVQYSMCASYHAAVFLHFFFAGMCLSGDLCVCKGVCVHWWVCVWHHCWVCAQCALWQIADLSGNVGAGFYFKSMSEQLELASTTNTQTVAQAHTSD